MSHASEVMPALSGLFDTDAGEVLGRLRSSVANVLASVGGIRKPADLQKALKLDWTLSWQLFQIAGVGGGGAGSLLAAGANVPSKSSLKKFLDLAQARGVEPVKVDRVLSSYEGFERLVEAHAGDRGSFNSMVTAAAGIDSEWLAADSQHRRNAYRAMSHVVGMQAKAKHICGIITDSNDGRTWDFGVVVGYVGLRMLRSLPSALVFRMRSLNPRTRQQTRRIGLGDEASAHGAHLLPDFSSQPLPALRTDEMDAGWISSSLVNPTVGNFGACTLRFGTAYLNHPVPGRDLDDPFFESDVAIDKPVEVLVSDSLVRPGLMAGCKPTADVLLGHNHSDTAQIPGDVVTVLGNHSIESMGTGPDALASPDVPNYPELLRAAGRRMGRDLEQFEAWRLRIEFPVYQATARIRWDLSNLK